MDFEKIAKQRAAKASAVEVESAREKLEASVAPIKGRPPMSIKELERQEARSPEEAATEEAQYSKAFEQKLAAQQAANAEALNMARLDDPFEGLRPDGKRRPGPKRQKESKRNDPNWTSFTAFCNPATKERIQNLVHLAKTAGDSKITDQSDALEAALTAYLDKQEKRLKGIIAKQIGV